MATVANNAQAMMHGGGAMTQQTMYSRGGDEGGKQVTAANYSFDQNSTQQFGGKPASYTGTNFNQRAILS